VNYDGDPESRTVAFRPAQMPDLLGWRKSWLKRPLNTSTTMQSSTTRQIFTRACSAFRFPAIFIIYKRRKNEKIREETKKEKTVLERIN
jgi:hypothetical protein